MEAKPLYVLVHRRNGRAHRPRQRAEIRNYWFASSDIESVTIPAGVLRLGVEAFYCCRRLRKITFAGDCRLQTIEEACFGGSALEKIVIPDSVQIIDDRAFCCCKALKAVLFGRKCRL